MASLYLMALFAVPAGRSTDEPVAIRRRCGVNLIAPFRSLRRVASRTASTTSLYREPAAAPALETGLISTETSRHRVVRACGIEHVEREIADARLEHQPRAKPAADCTGG